METPPHTPGARTRGAAGRRGSAWAWAWVLIAGVLAVRLAQVFLSPLELYPDEAQYWLWSRRLDWGYFSKPPMIAWAIRASTALGGDGEAWVRAPAPLFHAGAAAALLMAGRALFDARTGLWAAAVYLLMPGVALSSQVIATDAPLLFFLALAVWPLAALWRRGSAEDGAGEGGAGLAAAAGAALGAAVLSKYAALYIVGGLLLHALLDREGRRRLWTPSRAGAAAAAFLVVLAPNLAWNALHGFQTVAHTAADADLGEEARAARGLHPLGAVQFLLSQAGVFGPAPFAALVGACGLALARRADARDRWLLCLTLPAIAVVSVEAVAARANANWAGAAYAAGALLAARAPAWGGRWRPWLQASLAGQAGVVVAFSLAMLQPAWVETAGLGNTLKRAQGWRATADRVHAWRDAAQAGGPVTAVAVDDRFVFNALAYYGRAWIAVPGAPPLRMWVREARPHNQAETTAPLTAASGGRTAFLSTAYPDETRADFRRVTTQEASGVALGRTRVRPLLLFVGEGFAPRPRDPLSGRPTPP